MKSASGGNSPLFFSSGFSSGAAKKLAYQQRRWILSRLLRETLRERKDITLGQIELDSLHPVHGKEDDAGGEGLAVFNLRGEIVERCDIDTAQAEAVGRKMENRSPELFARVVQCRDDERAGTKGADGLGVLIKAGAGHDVIVVCGGGKMQTGQPTSRGAAEVRRPAGESVGESCRAYPPRRDQIGKYSSRYPSADVNGRFHFLLPSNQSPPARPSCKDGIAPVRAPAPCLRFDGDCVSTPPGWFVSRRCARGRRAARCQGRKNRARQWKSAVPAPPFLR